MSGSGGERWQVVLRFGAVVTGVGGARGWYRESRAMVGRLQSCSWTWQWGAGGARRWVEFGMRIENGVVAEKGATVVWQGVLAEGRTVAERGARLWERRRGWGFWARWLVLGRVEREHRAREVWGLGLGFEQRGAMGNRERVWV